MNLNHRVFDWTVRKNLRGFSGDRNPIHMNGTAARRTQMVAPIVHGITLPNSGFSSALLDAELLRLQPRVLKTQFLRPVALNPLPLVAKECYAN